MAEKLQKYLVFEKAIATSKASKFSSKEQKQNGPRPLWLLEPPRRLGEGDFTLLVGPERIESGWWDEADVKRDYFIAQTPGHSMLWIYRERKQPGGWFLHGVFG